MSNPIERLTNSVIGGDSKKAALIVSETNLYYLTAFPSTDGALLLTSEQAYYLLDFRYTEAARAKAQNVEVVEFTSLNETYKTLLKKHGITEVYMEYAALPYGHAKRFEQLSEECGAKAILNTTLDDAIRKQRIVKSDEEVKRICDAQAITDATFEHILPYIKEGVTEREIALEIEFFMRKEGADGNAFNPIVVTGANGSQCHGIPGNTQIKKGDLITMDTGAMLAGYHSDMTRTVALGYVNDEQRAIYNTVLKAQLAVIDGARPGMRCCDVDKIARDIIETPYPNTFGHGLGHGVGFGGVGHIQHVVRHKRLLLRRGLGGADVHAPVDLHGVHADDFAPKAPGQFQAQITLAAGRRACHGDHGGLILHGIVPLYCTRLKRFSNA